MCHISELAEEYVKSVSDVVKVGDIVRVKVIEVDENTGTIQLSRRAAMADENQDKESAEPVEVNSQSCPLAKTKRSGPAAPLFSWRVGQFLDQQQTRVAFVPEGLELLERAESHRQVERTGPVIELARP